MNRKEENLTSYFPDPETELAFLKYLGKAWPLWGQHVGSKKWHDLRQAFIAGSAALRASAAPEEGQSVMVPREPTGEMCFQGERAGMAYLAEARADMTIREARPFITAEIYKAMVACVISSAQLNNGAE